MRTHSFPKTHVIFKVAGCCSCEGAPDKNYARALLDTDCTIVISAHEQSNAALIMTEQSLPWGPHLDFTSYDTGKYHWKLLLLFLTLLVAFLAVLVSS
jgi:hypothetical protein